MVARNCTHIVSAIVWIDTYAVIAIKRTQDSHNNLICLSY